MENLEGTKTIRMQNVLAKFFKWCLSKKLKLDLTSVCSLQIKILYYINVEKA